MTRVSYHLSSTEACRSNWLGMRLEADPNDLDVLAARMKWVGEDDTLEDGARCSWPAPSTPS